MRVMRIPEPVSHDGPVTQRSGRMGAWPRWGLVWWPWLALLWHADGTLSLGVHVEPCARPHGKGFRYGPYVDLHLPGLCVSVGRNPVFCGSLESQRAYAKGKLPADSVRE